MTVLERRKRNRKWHRLRACRFVCILSRLVSTCQMPNGIWSIPETKKLILCIWSVPLDKTDNNMPCEIFTYGSRPQIFSFHHFIYIHTCWLTPKKCNYATHCAPLPKRYFTPQDKIKISVQQLYVNALLSLFKSENQGCMLQVRNCC